MKTKLTLLIILFPLFFIYEKANAQAPNWAWAKSAGTGSPTADDFGNSIALDANGNAYLIGVINGGPLGGWSTIFMRKYDQSGNILWTKNIGGNGNAEEGIGIAADSAGNIYITGSFKSNPVMFDNITLINAGGKDVFIAKLDTSGIVIWAKKAGGTGNDEGRDIALDANGNLFLTGSFKSAEITFDSITLTNDSAGFDDIFIAKYDPSGNVLWAKSAGGISNDNAEGVSVDLNGNSFITGGFRSPIIIFGTDTLTRVASNSDFFITKFDSFGNVIWAKSDEGSISCGSKSNGIVTDPFGNVFITGTFCTPLNIGSSSLIGDIFIVKYDPFGNVIWANSAKTKQNANSNSIAIDLNGNLYITGVYRDTLHFGNIFLPCGTYNDNVFIAKYDALGNILWAKNTANSSSMYPICSDIAVDVNGNSYIVGSFAASNFNFDTIVLHNALIPMPGYWTYDLFIAKLYNSITTGIGVPNPAENGVTIHPNPAISYFTITLPGSNKNYDISITDIKGEIMVRDKYFSPSNAINISTAYFPQGVYAVHVQLDGFIETKKVIVLK